MVVVVVLSKIFYISFYDYYTVKALVIDLVGARFKVELMDVIYL